MTLSLSVKLLIEPSPGSSGGQPRLGVEAVGLLLSRPEHGQA
ncbi:MAG TPA: hypothetical protein VHP11_03340 [Tepidisphaeraceae bacterium]|nr:hypothetical protein [Tepidisphaeraceae bacterium]